MDLQPVIQLIHISDTHQFKPTREDCDRINADDVGLANKFYKAVYLACLLKGKSHNYAKAAADKQVKDGFAYADDDALISFDRTIPSLLQNWPEKTWLVDTGDVSTWGDQGSISAHQTWLQDLAKRHSLDLAVQLHGNHDYWPSNFPSEATNTDIEKHRQSLRARPFPTLHSSAIPPIRIQRDRTLDCFTLSTPLWMKWDNVLAYGNVFEDQVFGVNPATRRQLDHLVAEIGKRRQSGTRSVRIVFCHHPLIRSAYEQKYLPGMRVKNNRAIANRLTPHVHLFLSGHTHTFYPSPDQTSDFRPLRSPSQQYVVGSLAIADSRTNQELEAAPYSCQQFQALRIYQQENDTLYIQRSVYTRPLNISPFTLTHRDANSFQFT